MVRELGEELGIDETAIELGVQLAKRSADHLVGGREVRQVERYFLARVSLDDVNPARATQPDNIREHRWWTEDELRSTRDTVYPQGLADLVAAVARGRTPAGRSGLPADEPGLRPRENPLGRPRLAL
ncbi:NUDIX domain-containing protein [Streptomyces sp. NPDC001978]|uniref:NUDIX domain-containing protein n=1 Tax=Streptomyces sp. NPDC001978 TaxID=3364627 RepID=UPI0036AA81E8